jgi:glycosyltransferase involved in cell wall biosynthesis
MPWAVERLDVRGYDVVLSVSHAVAKGVRTHPGQIHACLCLSPMRYAWDLRDQYLTESGLDHGVKGWLADRVLNRVQRWDAANSRRVHAWAAISHYIADRVRRAYGVESRVVYPPVDTEFFTLGTAPREDVYVTASRFVPYKRMDLIVRAFAAMPERRLVVVGDGPDWDKVRRAAGPNVEFTGRLPREGVREQLRRARAFVFAAEEDFGIAPVEAQACGTPVIAFARGGALETVVGPGGASPLTGVFFGEQTAASLIAAVGQFERDSTLFTPDACRANAERFAVAAFQAGIRDFIEAALQQPL